VHSLNKIIVAIVHAIPGVCNAFLILAIVMSIYAILAVEFYYEIGIDCHEPGSADQWMTTPRGGCVGEEYFGTFSKSLYSFFQVLTGESWSEMVSRPAMWAFYAEPLKIVCSGFFFVSYFLVSAFVLTNVVVAVLLDKMACDPEVAEAAVARASEDDDEGDEPLETVGLDGTIGVHEASNRSIGSNGSTGDVSTNNGQEQHAAITSEDVSHMMTAITNQVDHLMNASEKMSSEFDSFRGEMTSMKQQIISMIHLYPNGTGKL